MKRGRDRQHFNFRVKSMSDIFSDLQDIFGALDKRERAPDTAPDPHRRAPVHVVYGGAHLFTQNTPRKLGRVAISSIVEYAPDFAHFARAMWLPGADSLPTDDGAVRKLEFALVDDPRKMLEENRAAWLAWSVYRRTLQKLETEPVEDFRIDFEDGYGIRTDAEEDSHCESASKELAELHRSNGMTPFCGFRIKSFQPETRERAVRTLDLFLTNLLRETGGELPPNFVVTLPKVRFPEETAALDRLLSRFEEKNGLTPGEIGTEILVETPEAIENMRSIVEASGGRCVAAHFGAYDYTSGYGIAAVHQHIRHEACIFARNMMQVRLTPLGIRLSDSVTTELPVPVHRGEDLSVAQLTENRLAVTNAWRRHFNNVTRSLIDGFYQSWDLHPAQLVARYAAVYAFFLETREQQALRLRGFLEKATKAMTTGNQFDDLASAEGLLNFFLRGLACGAFGIGEVTRETGLSADELATASFVRIMERKHSGTGTGTG